jgi:glycosyltransferase EpsF
MKRILQIVGTMDRAGAETMVMNLYRAIDKTKFQFDFVYFTSKKCDYDDEIESLGGKIHRIITNNPIKRANELTMLLKQNPQWEIVHAHTLFSNAFHMYAAYRAGVKRRIAHSHNTSDKSKNGIVSLFYQNISRKIQSKYATEFVACGEAAGKFLFPKEKNVLMMPNSIDTKLFVDAATNSKLLLKKELLLNEATLVILQLGRLSKVKNHVFTIAIAEELKKQSINFKLLFAGQGDLKEDLEQQVKAKGLEQDILFLGLRTDIPELLAGSDLMLMPSLYEGFPVVLVESQAAGTPALISDSISSEVDLGTNLIYFESLESSVKVWVERMQQILQTKKMDSQQRIEKLQQAGFDIYTNVKHLEELYIQ